MERASEEVLRDWYNKNSTVALHAASIWLSSMTVYQSQKEEIGKLIEEGRLQEAQVLMDAGTERARSIVVDTARRLVEYTIPEEETPLDGQQDYLDSLPAEIMAAIQAWTLATIEIGAEKFPIRQGTIISDAGVRARVASLFNDETVKMLKELLNTEGGIN